MNWQPLYPIQLEQSGLWSSLLPTTFVLPGSFHFKAGLFAFELLFMDLLQREFGNFFSFMGIYIEVYFISEFPWNTYSLAHAVFPLGDSSVLNAVTADVWNNFLCILQCKTKKCKEWQEVILWSIHLYHSQTLPVNEIPQLSITDIALVETFYLQNTGEGFPPQIRSWLLCASLMELIIFLYQYFTSKEIMSIQPSSKSNSSNITYL